MQTYSERVHGLLEHSSGLLFPVMAVDCADFEMVKFPAPRGTGHAFPLFAILPKRASRTKSAFNKSDEGESEITKQLWARYSL